MTRTINAAIVESGDIGSDLIIKFLHHTEKANIDHGVDARAILVELRRRRMLGGERT